MKTNKLLFSILLAITLFAQCAALPAYAAQPIPNEPQYNNVSSTKLTVSVSNSGLMTIIIGYSGKSGVTTGATIETYIEKKVNGTWTRVSIGQVNNKWVDSPTTVNYSGTHTHQLSSNGTYRVTATFTVYGSGGSADKITRRATVTY